MSDRPTPETDAEWDRLQMLPGGGYSSQVAGVKLSFGLARWASTLERQRDEARENAQHWCDMHILAVKDFNEAQEQIAKANSEREQLWSIMHDAYQPLISAGNYELSERIRFLLERGPQAYHKKFSEEKAADEDLTERENDTQSELAAWELLKETRGLARELRNAMRAITPYIGYPSTPTDVVYQFKNALTKAKEVLP